jgi:membrane protein YdbS with pleckstrin-like domain
MIQKNVSLKLPQAVLYYRIISLVIISVIIAVFTYFVPQTTSYSVFIGVGFLVLTVVYAIIYLVTYSYTVSDDSITINSGVLFKDSKTVNYNDLQNMQVKRGPLLMAFGLADVQGFTSSPGQLVISSSGRGGTNTTVKPDVEIVLTTEDANELAQMMHVGDIQKVKQV